MHSRHLGFSEKDLRDPIHSLGSTFSISQFLRVFLEVSKLSLSRDFQRRLWSFQQILFNSSHTSFIIIPVQYTGSLCSYLLIFDHLTACLAELLLGSWSSQSFHFWIFSEVFGRTAPLLWATPREVWYPPYVFLILWWWRFWKAASLISGGIFNVDFFTRVLWEGEDKIEVI